MSKKLLIIIFVFTAFSVFSQTPEILPSPTPVSLEKILAEAEKQTVIYRNNFNNLLAEEIKTFDDYDKNGEIKKTRRIESNFLVYQSIKIPQVNTEYRNVTKVDGKPVGDAEKRAEDFFKDVLNSNSAEKELEKIQKESSRYDRNLDIRGLTLNQSPILAAHIRTDLNFNLTGEETLENREVYVIDYVQKTKNPYIVFNDDKTNPGKLFLRYSLDLPKQFRKNAPFLSGRLWIDKENFQVLAEKRNVLVRPENNSEPATILEMSFNYQISELGVLTPKKIVLTDYNIRARKDDFSVSKSNTATFEYTKFTLSDVEVQSGEVDASKLREN